MQDFVMPFGLIGWMVAVFVVVYFATRIPWWSRQSCVPSPETVEYVQAHAPEWGRRGAGWITGFPSEVNAWGFLATPLWLLIVGLNLVLLAQSLELFMPSAQRVEIPFFGSYTWLSLLAGCLFSLSQSVFGIIAGEVKRRSIVVVCLCLVALSICVEMGLAGYRSYLIITHVVDVDANTADSLLSKGVALTMFISFLVPTAHTALGFISVPRFLVPLANYLPRLVGGILVLVWSWLVRFFFGFQRVVIVPAAISELRKEVSDLKGSIAKTGEGAKLQGLRELRDMGMPFGDLQDEAGRISNEAASLREEWKCKLADLTERIQALSNRPQADGANEQRAGIIEESANFKAAMERRGRTRAADAKRLIGLLEALPKADQNWHAKHEELVAAVPRLELEIQQEKNELQSLRGIFTRCALTLNPPPDADPAAQAGGDIGILELARLRRRAIEAEKPSERNRIHHVLHLCATQLNQIKKELDAAETALFSITQNLTDLSKKLADVKPPLPAPPAQTIQAEKRKLEAAVQDIVSASLDISAGVTRFARVSKRRKGGLFGWIGRILSEFVDAIMGANDEKKRKAAEKDPETRAVPVNALNDSVNLSTGGQQ